MIVVDTSAVIAVVAGAAQVLRLKRRLNDDTDLHAPHLIDVEVLSALRRMLIAGQISELKAETARLHFSELALTRYPHHRLADRIWALRNNITSYDAAFVALSEALDVPLVTCDTRLAASAGHSAKIELFT